MSKLNDMLNLTLNRFRNISVAHHVGVKWDNDKNIMTFYQLGLKFNIVDLFAYCYLPNSKKKGILFAEDVRRLLDVQHYLSSSGEDYFIVPKELGFDIYVPNSTGAPLLVHEVSFMSITNRIVLWYMSLLPTYRKTFKNMKNG